MKYLLFSFAISLLVIIVAAAWAYYDMYHHLSRPDAKKWP